MPSSRRRPASVARGRRWQSSWRREPTRRRTRRWDRAPRPELCPGRSANAWRKVSTMPPRLRRRKGKASHQPRRGDIPRRAAARQPLPSPQSPKTIPKKVAGTLVRGSEVKWSRGPVGSSRPLDTFATSSTSDDSINRAGQRRQERCRQAQAVPQDHGVRRRT